MHHEADQISSSNANPPGKSRDFNINLLQIKQINNPDLTLQDLFEIEDANLSAISALNSYEEIKDKHCIDCQYVNNQNPPPTIKNLQQCPISPILMSASTSSSSTNSSSRFSLINKNVPNVIARLMGLEDFPNTINDKLKERKQSVAKESCTNNYRKGETCNIGNQRNIVSLEWDRKERMNIQYFSADRGYVCNEGFTAEKPQGDLKIVDTHMAKDENCHQKIAKRLAQVGLLSSEKEQVCFSHLLEITKEKNLHAKPLEDPNCAPKSMPLLPKSKDLMLRGDNEEYSVNDNPINILNLRSPHHRSHFSILQNNSLDYNCINGNCNLGNDLSFRKSFIKLSCFLTLHQSRPKICSDYCEQMSSNNYISYDIATFDDDVSTNQLKIKDFSALGHDHIVSSSVQSVKLNSESVEVKKLIKDVDTEDEKGIVSQEEGRSKPASSRKNEAVNQVVRANYSLIKGPKVIMASEASRKNPGKPSCTMKQSMLNTNSKSNQESRPNKVSSAISSSRREKHLTKGHAGPDYSISSTKVGNRGLTSQDSSSTFRKKQKMKPNLSIKIPQKGSRNLRNNEGGIIKREISLRNTVKGSRKVESAYEQRKSGSYIQVKSNCKEVMCKPSMNMKNTQDAELRDFNNSHKKGPLKTTNQIANEEQTLSAWNKLEDIIALNPEDTTEGRHLPNKKEGKITYEEEYWKGVGKQSEIKSSDGDMMMKEVMLIGVGDLKSALEKGEWAAFLMGENGNVNVIVDSAMAVIEGRLADAFQQLHMGRHISGGRGATSSAPENPWSMLRLPWWAKVVGSQVWSDLQCLLLSTSAQGEKAMVAHDLASTHDTWPTHLDAEVIYIVRVLEEIILGDILQEEFLWN